MHRRDLLVRGGILVLGGGAGALRLASPTAAATDEELALARLGASGELVANSFLFQALGSTVLDSSERRWMRRARFADQRHYSVLVRAIGPGAPTFEDFDIAFPAGAFRSRRRLLEVAIHIKETLLGVYLNAAALISDAALRASAARIGASEAMQLAGLRALADRQVLDAPLPHGLDVEAATVRLERYWR